MVSSGLALVAGVGSMTCASACATHPPPLQRLLQRMRAAQVEWPFNSENGEVDMMPGFYFLVLKNDGVDLQRAARVAI